MSNSIIKEVVISVSSAVIGGAIMFLVSLSAGLLESKLTNDQVKIIAESLIEDQENVSRLSEEIVKLQLKKLGIKKIASGDSGKGSTRWIKETRNPAGIFVDVDTSESSFTSTPHYVVSLHGDHHVWDAATPGVYYATEKGFRVYVKNSDGSNLDIATAERGRWHVIWHAIAIQK